MAFIPSPTPLWVRAHAADGNLRFAGTTTILARYLKHTRDLPKPKPTNERSTLARPGIESTTQVKSLCEPKATSLEPLKAWRADGKTELDAALFEFQDVGLAAPRTENGAEVRLAQMTFRGDQYTALYSDAEKRRCDARAQAMFEAFLEHETIQIRVSIGNLAAASLVLKLGLIYSSDGTRMR